jgi:hypothetical protein
MMASEKLSPGYLIFFSWVIKSNTYSKKKEVSLVVSEDQLGKKGQILLVTTLAWRGQLLPLQNSGLLYKVFLTSQGSQKCKCLYIMY